MRLDRNNYSNTYNLFSLIEFNFMNAIFEYGYLQFCILSNTTFDSRYLYIFVNIDAPNKVLNDIEF